GGRGGGAGAPRRGYTCPGAPRGAPAWGPPRRPPPPPPLPCRTVAPAAEAAPSPRKPRARRKAKVAPTVPAAAAARGAEAPGPSALTVAQMRKMLAGREHQGLRTMRRAQRPAAPARTPAA